MTDMDDGTAAVRIARTVMAAEVSGGTPDIECLETFSRPAGVFVTIRKYPSGDLRGCIGYPEPVFPLIEALVRSARGACRDPRFPDLRRNELDSVTAEVTILSGPERMTGDKQRLLRDVVIGRDGLMIESAGRRGLLLPQVPGEWGWDTKEYLENLSMKAGLRKDAWERPDSVIYSFTGEIFSETVPNGEVVRG
jgi:uncharacterized protein (TIGR00296 family)